MFCWHKWTRWTEPKMVSLRAFPTMYGVRTGASYELSKLEQHRECVKCGEYQHRLLGPEE